MEAEKGESVGNDSGAFSSFGRNNTNKQAMTMAAQHTNMPVTVAPINPLFKAILGDTMLLTIEPSWATADRTPKVAASSCSASSTHDTVAEARRACMTDMDSPPTPNSSLPRIITGTEVYQTPTVKMKCPNVIKMVREMSIFSVIWNRLVEPASFCAILSTQ